MSLSESVLRARAAGQTSAPGARRRGIGRTDSVPAARALGVALACALALAIVMSFARAVPDWSAAAAVALALLGVSAVWVAGGAATAILGLVAAPARADPPRPDWRPRMKTAILVTLCGEEAAPVARRLAALGRALEREGLGASTRIFVLSDTSGTDSVAAEEAALAGLAASGALSYRRRLTNAGKKPGNIAEWLAAHGDGHDLMLVLDADSRMSARRIRAMIHRMERRPRLGLLQAGIALVPGRSRFGRHQRVSARLLSPNFGRGFAAWSGASGNYWGHNAIMRVDAFRAAADLPVLPGRAPMGGPLLSHDFIEAAWIRRAGWDVELDPDMAGSAEDAPQTMAEFHRRDRRWCQGNLQHLRLLAEPGLDPVSRIHLVAGIVSYLAAPVWLAVVALIASGAVAVKGALPFAVVAFVLAAPKLCAIAGLLRRARTGWRRRVALRAGLGELAVSSVVAPLVMVRQTAAVLSVCMGRDCGWRPGERARALLPRGAGEMAAGAAIAALAAVSGGAAALWLAPVVLPLIFAPAILRRLDARPA
jgi:membrane glycosyltransferase